MTLEADLLEGRSDDKSTPFDGRTAPVLDVLGPQTICGRPVSSKRRHWRRRRLRDALQLIGRYNCKLEVSDQLLKIYTS